METLYHYLAFPLETCPQPLSDMLVEYRVMVNEAIRYSLAHDARSRRTMQPCYAQLRRDHPRALAMYLCNARDDALRHRAEPSAVEWPTSHIGYETQAPSTDYRR